LALHKVSCMIGASITFISTLISALKRHRNLALENLALRQQLAVFKRRHPRPKLQPTDRLFWIWLSRVWMEWRESLIIVKPETVIGWHRKGFRLFWTKLSRRKRVGRPMVGSEVRGLIKEMAQANPLWGAPRIHGELLKLGIEVSASKRLAVDAQRQEASFSNVTNLPRQSPSRDGLDRFPHRSDGRISRAVCASCTGAPPQARGAFQRDQTSNSSLDSAANHRSLS
jgi:hypothetical protein